MKKQREKVAALFEKAGHAHHQAFIETDGEDPEWPLWYAEYLHERLLDLLDADITKSEVVYLLVRLSREQSRVASETPWNEYYADNFVEQFGSTLRIPIDDVPFLSTDQMIEVDRAMIENYHIELIQMMENAGQALAHLARSRFFNGDPRGNRVVVLVGTGGNGGGALVCARRLHNYGATVQVFATKPDDQFTPVPAHQLEILQRMSVPVAQAGEIGEQPADLVIDGIIGYRLEGAPYGAAGDLIRWANSQAAPVLSLDAPSGVDTTTGTAFEPAIQATATMTLALPKKGLRAEGISVHVGELYLADISVPPELYAEPALNLRVGHIFAESDIVRLQ